MKKIICLLSTLLLLSASVITVYAQGANSKDNLSIPSYNKAYSENSKENTFLSLQEYNTEYSNGENPLKITSPLTTQNISDIYAISPVQTQTKPIILANQNVEVGTITLQYQTDIQGGRPQFLYDTCYLSHPNITTYWSLETSHVEFSGDRIGVYFSFIYGPLQDHAWVYFYPN